MSSVQFLVICRSKLVITLISTVIALFNLIPVYAVEKDTITWFAAHWPPLMMLKGEDKGTGRVDMRLQLYQTELSQYNHNTNRGK
ncbi:hypothetical protein [Spartinivicinus ruber]|uniref:hypothetical protein n=1 Tax=Spartinivicinus ruber TaxID=2683272 RepID=UPI0013D76B4A|nr:hypothetical protein [Spartinivicinus ruber]